MNNALFLTYRPSDIPATISMLGHGSISQERKWYAISTLPRNEQSVARYLDANQIESFLPTCESVRRWRNRQCVTVVEALFPTYIFVRIHKSEQSSVLRSPGVRRIVGNHKGPLPLPNCEVDFLRTRLGEKKLEAVKEPAIGERVRICRGPMHGIEGTLIRKKSSLRFVLTLELINQSAALEVTADEIEPVAQ
jgi:transcription antitermination factor NusG